MILGFSELQILSTGVGLLIVFAGVIAVFVRLQTRIKIVEGTITLMQERHDKCAIVQAERYKELIRSLHAMDATVLARLAEVDAKAAVTVQKLNDLVEWYKNGRRRE